MGAYGRSSWIFTKRGLISEWVLRQQVSCFKAAAKATTEVPSLEEARILCMEKETREAECHCQDYITTLFETVDIHHDLNAHLSEL